MFEPYATTLVAWTGMTRPLGFEMVEDENFSAVLSRADGARIHFSADRAYNGLTVGIVPVSSADRISGYALCCSWKPLQANFRTTSVGLAGRTRCGSFRPFIAACSRAMTDTVIAIVA